MGVEAVTNIDDLNPANPLAGDVVSAGDDHIRNIKTALTNNFAGIGGNVTATHTELNYLDITTLGTAEASKAVTIDSGSAYTLAGMTCADAGILTTADINGGTADNVVIGGGTAAAITGTTIKADTSLELATGATCTGIADEDDMTSDSATLLATQRSIKAYVGDLSKVAVINYEETANTAGEVYTAGGWRTVDLDTEAYDASAIVTVGSSQVTPIAGTYRLHAELAIFTITGALDAKLRLYNATGTAAVASGVQLHSGAGNQQTANATLDCVFTANGSSAYEIQVYPLSNANDATPAMNIGENEIYAQVTLEKIG